MSEAFFLGLSRAGFGLAIQSTILLALGLVVGAMVRRRGPVARALVYRGTMAALVLSAVLSLSLAAPMSERTLISLPQAQAGRPFLDTTRVANLLPVSKLPASEPAPDIQRERFSAVETRRTASFWRTLAVKVTPRAFLGQVWLLVAGLLLLRMIACHVLLSRERHRCASVADPEILATLEELCVQRRVRPPVLLSGGEVRGPYLSGFRRPAIVLPASYADDFPETALRAVLAHEVAHLARRDCWWSLGARLICILGWMQPLLWWVCRRYEQSVEEACDEEVVRHGCSAPEYARCLVELAERLLPTSSARLAGATVIPSRSSLGKRVEGILKRCASGALPLPKTFPAGIGIGTLVAAAAAVVLVSTSWTPARGEGKGVKQALTGRVVVEDGRPVKGLRVLAFVKPDVPPAPNEGPGLTFGIPFVEADGTYRVEGLPDGEATICLFEPEERTATAVKTRVRDGKGVAPDLVVAPGGTIEAVVRDREGKPLEGITMAVMGPDRPQEVLLDRRFRTAADGRVTIPVSAGESTLKILGPVDWSKLGNDKSPPETKISVTLSRGETKPAELKADERYYGSAVLTGRVVFPDGKPASGIRVMAQVNETYYQQPGARIDDTGPFEWAEDLSKTDGSYRLAGLMTAPFNVSVEDPKDEWVAAAAENVPAVLRTTFHPTDLKLTHGAFVQGTVTDIATGKPVKEVPIGSYGPHRPRSSAMIIRTETDDKGRYRLRVAPGESFIYVQDPRYGKHEVTLPLKEGETKELPFKVTLFKE
jgi:beta-lactamase regulating signal transducer with metallopeptidase domain